jgi:hypothetical protein
MERQQNKLGNSSRSYSPRSPRGRVYHKVSQRASTDLAVGQKTHLLQTLSVWGIDGTEIHAA